MKEEIKKKYKVQERIMETPTVFTLKFLVDGGIPKYIPGQFITIYFPELGTPEGKAYSISSSPNESTINITVKAMGIFSNKLCSLVAGDIVSASLPYGYFYSESKDSDLVMIAGGIGIVPFRSMIVDCLEKFPNRKIALFYSNQTTKDIIFKKEFDNLSLKNPTFKVIYYITRQKISDPNFINNRICVEDIVGNVKVGLKKIAGREFLICGSIPFVRDFWKNLKDQGVSEDNLYTEAFFSH